MAVIGLLDSEVGPTPRRWGSEEKETSARRRSSTCVRVVKNPFKPIHYLDFRLTSPWPLMQGPPPEFVREYSVRI